MSSQLDFRPPERILWIILAYLAQFVLMYPFNRTTSIHAENASPSLELLDEDGTNSKMYSNLHVQMENQLQEVQQAPPASPVEKTILASILEMSNINDKWVKTLETPSGKKEKKQRSASLFECSWR
ncbi:unnamed protein product [Caenorhabditis sp. 36 PRJEB53466]|nr:unnamed protein product [Caenorhabditis sp. 36 PRJEB53466]